MTRGLRGESRQRSVVRFLLVGILAVAGIATPKPASAYSVLTHEANIDVLWDSSIKPLLRARFPSATADQLLEARAYAYGGCVIQDLGYYPFGSHFFSNLLHYVRSGDFVRALIRDARDVDEYAFALGALGHYAADNDGHRLAINKTVPLLYPKIEARFGHTVTYEESPKAHLMVEFAFDVVQVAGGAYAPQAYHQYIGFKVAKPALERAYREIYGLELKDLFVSEDLAIATYRHAVATTIPEMTKVAWKKKREQIEQVTPGIDEATFVFNLDRRAYEKEFGSDYAKPHGLARFIGFIYKLVPKIGPFRTLSFTVPTPEAERLFLDSFVSTRQRFRRSLESVRSGQLNLPNLNLDTGQVTMRGEYGLADETYGELLDKLAEREYADVPAALGANIVAFYGATDSRIPQLVAASAGR
jgi:Zinc dependent phospholipase C